MQQTPAPARTGAANLWPSPAWKTCVTGQIELIAGQLNASKTEVVIALLNEGLARIPARVGKAIAVLLLVMACALPAHAFRLGVFFVHGKGSAALANKYGPGSAYEYWDNGAFMNYVNLVDNIGGCNIITDFSAVDGRWRPEITSFGGYFYGTPTVAGGGVAQQLAQFIRANGITDLIIVTHSMGGNTVRTLLSRSDFWQDCDARALSTQPWNYDPFCEDQHQSQILIQQTTKVIFTVQAPAAGSEAADVAQAFATKWPKIPWLTNWLSGNDDSTFGCKTTYMNKQNASWLYGYANTKYGKSWPQDNPAYLASWVALSAWNFWYQLQNDGAHAEDGGLVSAGSLIPWSVATDGTNGLSDGLVSWWSQRVVGYTANAPGQFYNTVTRNNHFHGTYSHGLGETCSSSWTGSCYPTDGMRVGLCRPYLGTCPYLYWTPVPPGSNYSQCLLRETCVGAPWGADFSVRIQNTVWAYAHDRCGLTCEGCGITACVKCCPISNC